MIRRNRKGRVVDGASYLSEQAPSPPDKFAPGIEGAEVTSAFEGADVHLSCLALWRGELRFCEKPDGEWSSSGPVWSFCRDCV